MWENFVNSSVRTVISNNPSVLSDGWNQLWHQFSQLVGISYGIRSLRWLESVMMSARRSSSKTWTCIALLWSLCPPPPSAPDTQLEAGMFFCVPWVSRRLMTIQLSLYNHHGQWNLGLRLRLRDKITVVAVEWLSVTKTKEAAAGLKCNKSHAHHSIGPPPRDVKGIVH